MFHIAFSSISGIAALVFASGVIGLLQRQFRPLYIIIMALLNYFTVLVSMTFLAISSLLLTGFGLGLLISAPVGPVNILCIQYSLARGFWAGVVALGLTFISEFMQTYEAAIQIVGDLILLGFGLRLFFSHPQMLEPTDVSLNPFRHLGSAPQSFLLTISNLGALLGIFAVVGSAGTAMGGLATMADALCLLAGLFLGGAVWWLVLARLVSLFRAKMTEKRLSLINQSAGLILLVCGFALILNSLFFL